MWTEEKCFDAATMKASGAPVVAVFTLLPQKNLDIDENQLFLFPLYPILLLIVMVLNFINLDNSANRWMYLKLVS